MKYFVLLLGGVWSSWVSSTPLFQANVHQSQWEMTTSSPMMCQLRHPIPRFGVALFEQRAGAQPLRFSLLSSQRRAVQGDGQWLSLPTAWQKQNTPNSAQNVPFFPYAFVQLVGDFAWGVVAQLQQGQRPVFVEKKGQVAISPVQFESAWQNFTDCTQQLLPFTFEDIRFSVLTFFPDGDDWDDVSQRRLAEIETWLQYSPNPVRSVSITAYQSAQEDLVSAQLSSEWQAERVKKWFLNQGVDARRIQTEARGGYGKVVSHHDPLAVQKNRRIVVKLE